MVDGLSSAEKREEALKNYKLIVPKHAEHLEAGDGLPPFRKAKESDENVELRFLWIKGRVLAVDRVSRSYPVFF